MVLSTIILAICNYRTLAWCVRKHFASITLYYHRRSSLCQKEKALRREAWLLWPESHWPGMLSAATKRARQSINIFSHQLSTYPPPRPSGPPEIPFGRAVAAHWSDKSPPADKSWGLFLLIIWILKPSADHCVLKYSEDAHVLLIVYRIRGGDLVFLSPFLDTHKWP